MTHNWWIVIEFKCFVCILWQFSSMISNSLQFWQFCQLSFQLKAGLNLNGLCALWLEYDLVDIEENDAVITGCYADYKGGIRCWLVENIVWWFFSIFRTLLFTEKPDTRMDEKTVLIKISILDEWKYWYSTFHIFCCLPRPQQNRWRFVKIWNLDFVSRRWKETKHPFMTDKRIFIVLIPLFCKIPRERYLF